MACDGPCGRSFPPLAPDPYQGPAPQCTKEKPCANRRPTDVRAGVTSHCQLGLTGRIPSPFARPSTARRPEGPPSPGNLLAPAPLLDSPLSVRDPRGTIGRGMRQSAPMATCSGNSGGIPRALVTFAPSAAETPHQHDRPLRRDRVSRVPFCERQTGRLQAEAVFEAGRVRASAFVRLL